CNFFPFSNDTPSPLPYIPPVIALLDYGAGNLRSVDKALRFVGADVRIVTRPAAMKDADAAVLPGVGAFDDCMNSLGTQALLEPTQHPSARLPALSRHPGRKLRLLRAQLFPEAPRPIHHRNRNRLRRRLRLIGLEG